MTPCSPDPKTNATRDGVHTIPVPRGWSPEQAWEAIRRGDELTDPEPAAWANVLVENGHFVELLPATHGSTAMYVCSGCGREWGEAPDDEDATWPWTVAYCEECAET